jgi:hypothetical protein
LIQIGFSNKHKTLIEFGIDPEKKGGDSIL